MSYPFWLKNQADEAGARAAEARRDVERAKKEKKKIENAANKFADSVESLLDEFEIKGDAKDLVEKLKRSVREFKESE